MSGQPLTHISSMQQVQEFIQAGRYADAVALLEGICRSAPGNARAWYQLGCSQAKLRQWGAAAEALQRSIELQPGMAWSHFALGGAQLKLAQLDPAADSFRAALDLDPGLAEAHTALANIHLTKGNLVQARSHLQQALAINPGMSDAHCDLGRLEEEAGNHETAIEHLQRALKHNPLSPPALCSMGSALMNLARMEEAVACYRQALQINPHSAEAVAGLVTLHEFKGEADKGMELIEPLLAKESALNPSVVIAFARICKHVGRCDEAVAAVTRMLESRVLTRRTRRMLHFGAGKALDHMKQYDAAFAHYKAGNDIDMPLYDAVGHAQAIDNIMKVFVSELFMRLPRANRNDQRPVFIVGMPRSGTSLTEQILAAHPLVYGAGELDTLSRIVATASRQLGCGQAFSQCVDRLGQGDTDRMAGEYLQCLDGLSQGAQRITDKMPHNFYYLGLIQQLFPGARVIHCVRDPLDTGLSIYFQDFNKSHKYARSLFDIGVHYHQYRRLMEHWKRVLSLPLLEVRYEELVSDPQTVVRRMLEFCALEWDDSCLQFHDSYRPVHTASYDQVRQPLYKKSIARWRNYEPYLDDLKEGLQRGY